MYAIRVSYVFVQNGSIEMELLLCEIPLVAGHIVLSPPLLNQKLSQIFVVLHNFSCNTSLVEPEKLFYKHHNKDIIHILSRSLILIEFVTNILRILDIHFEINY